MKSYLANTLLGYLRFWSKYRLSRIDPKIIGITGSIGKTSCAYLFSSVLTRHFKTKTTYHGNSETGLPLELLDLRDDMQDYSYLNWLKVMIKAPIQALFVRPEWEMVIAEMGIDSPFEPKNMSYLLKIIKPDIGIFLNVAPVHSEQFMSVVNKNSKTLKSDLIEAIALQKGLLVTTLDSTKTAIINIDYSQIKKLTPLICANLRTIGTSKFADYHLLKYTISLSGTEFLCQTPSGQVTVRISNQLLVKEFSASVLALLATTDKLSLPVDEVLQDLDKHLELPSGRQSILQGKNGSTIIDSSYNSSPIALEHQLEMLKTLKTRGKKIVCLGDMNELGEISASEHRRTGLLASQNADVIILVGNQMTQYALPEIQKSKPTDLFVFKTAEGVGDFIAKNILTKDDLILVKGSQNRVFLEQVVADLLAEPSSKKLLCRQSDFWDHKRRTYFGQNPNQQIYPAN